MKSLGVGQLPGGLAVGSAFSLRELPYSPVIWLPRAFGFLERLFSVRTLTGLWWPVSVDRPMTWVENHLRHNLNVPRALLGCLLLQGKSSKASFARELITLLKAGYWNKALWKPRSQQRLALACSAKDQVHGNRSVCQSVPSFPVSIDCQTQALVCPLLFRITLSSNGGVRRGQLSRWPATCRTTERTTRSFVVMEFCPAEQWLRADLEFQPSW